MHKPMLPSKRPLRNGQTLLIREATAADAQAVIDHVHAISGETDYPGWGSRQEMLAVYSVVNTVLASAPEITSVILLRNGQQRPTFAGHLDTSRPLLANQQLVATQ